MVDAPVLKGEGRESSEGATCHPTRHTVHGITARWEEEHVRTEDGSSSDYPRGDPAGQALHNRQSARLTPRTSMTRATSADVPLCADGPTTQGIPRVGSRRRRRL